jgi:hypothetical protein
MKYLTSLISGTANRMQRIGRSCRRPASWPDDFTFLTAVYRPFRFASINQVATSPSGPQRHALERSAFAVNLGSVDEAPEPFRQLMREALEPGRVAQRLIFGPSQKTVGKAAPASLLAILQREWVAIIGGEDSEPKVYRCQFAHTLFLEITDILLYGMLRIGFVHDGRARSVAIQFNTVMWLLYQDAIELLLCRMDDQYRLLINDNRNELHAASTSIPLKFRNGIARYLPDGQHALGVVYWQAAVQRQAILFRRELAPQGVLVVTSKHIVVVSEGKTWSRSRPNIGFDYGYFVIYCPLSRIMDIGMREDSFVDAIALRVGVGQWAHELRIGFPHQQRNVVAGFLNLIRSYLSPPSPGPKVPNH